VTEHRTNDGTAHALRTGSTDKPPGVLDLTRRGLLGGAALIVAGCDPKQKWHNVDVSGAFPPLSFTMTRATDGAEVNATAYRGKVVLLYFGYTYCPDICPLTLGNLARVLGQIGPDAEHVRVLFVTVDPNRDSLATLKAYTAQFAPQIVGLRGTPDQLAALARTYRIAYSVNPGDATHAYEVTHSAAVYVFDASGATRLLVPSMDTANPDIKGTAADLRQLIAIPIHNSIWDRLARMV
jgi:protein SCO1/2